MSETPKTETAALRVAKLAAVLASTHDAVIGTTPQGTITTWNPAATALYGYTSDEVVGRDLDLLIPLDERPAEVAIFNRVLRGEPAVQFHGNRLCRDGSLVSVSVTISSIVDATEEIVGAVMVSRRVGTPLDAPDWSADWSKEDIAEHRVQTDADDEIKDASAQRAQRMELLGRLAGGIAHDFNNLLGVILNYAEFVTESLNTTVEPGLDWSNLRDEAKHDLIQIQRAVSRGSELTHQLLAFARREVIRPRVLDVNKSISEIEDLLRRTMGTDMELIVILPSNLWPILADPGQIEQVLVNLAINARDAMPEGGTLCIDTSNVSADAGSLDGAPANPAGHRVRLRVSDNGTGMASDVAAHVFEPFFTTKGAGLGTGLGLATVQSIVSQADGTIELETELGVGSTFTMMFPVTAEAAIEVDETAFCDRAPNGETVLVVEDQEALRTVAGRILTQYGYSVLLAASGPEALDLVGRHDGPIDILITDVVMPGMLGKEVAERIHGLRPEVAVLYMSGYAQPVLASQGRLDPGVALLDKPFTAAALLSQIALVLRHRSTRGKP